MTDKTIEVMVIEDEVLLLKAISRKLTAMGFKTISFTSAKQAIDYLNNSPKKPDAIWLDYYLGEIDGLEFMQRIKANDEWKHIPVIVVSNSASEKKKSAMLALGVKEYLLKAENRLEDIGNTIKELVTQSSDQTIT